jgi:hypothetical protein
LHNGFQWTDSSNNEKSNISNRSIIVDINDSSVTVNVDAVFSIHNTISQAGMTIEQNLKGYSNGKRIYNKQNGLLKKKAQTLPSPEARRLMK